MNTTASALCVVVLLLASQAADPGPTRFGRVGRDLAESEVAQIANLASVSGTRPWLLFGGSSMLVGQVRANVYLRPSAAQDVVQRGVMMELEADTPPQVQQRSPWRVRATRSFAHIAAPGRRLGEVVSETDVNWPFVADRDIDDETLITLTAFIWSNPSIPDGAQGANMRGWVAAPILGVYKRPDDFVVAFRLDEQGHSVQRVYLTRQAGGWVIIGFDAAIA